MKLIKLCVVAISTTLFVSCTKDDDFPAITLGDYEQGIFITNEGNSIEQGTISFLSNDLSRFNQNTYSAVNANDKLGTYIQNIFYNGDNMYIIAGGSNKITVVNRKTFKLIAKIETGFNNPRYGVVKNGKAYVTNANTYEVGIGNTDDFISVIDLAKNKVESTIELNATANRIVMYNNKLYITEPYNSNKLLVVNTDTNTLEPAINIGASADSMEIKDGNLYILRPSQLVTIKLSDNNVTTIDFPSEINAAKNLDIEGNKIYYTSNGAVYAMDVTATTPSTTPIFTHTTTPTDYTEYGFAVGNGHIFIANVGSFSESSKVYVYTLAGKIEKELITGIGPNGFYFND